MLSNCNIPFVHASCVIHYRRHNAIQLYSIEGCKLVFSSDNYMLLTASIINEVERRWVAGSFTFFYLIQAEKATFNLTLSEMDLNHAQRIIHILFQLNRAQWWFVHSCVRLCVKQLESILYLLTRPENNDKAIYSTNITQIASIGSYTFYIRFLNVSNVLQTFKECI